MMGTAQTNLDVPVVKGTSGITVLAGDGVKSGSYDPCIRCASCVEACPVDLMPYRIGDLGRMEKVDVFKQHGGGLTCIECGCCSFVCPTNRPSRPLDTGWQGQCKGESGRQAEESRVTAANFPDGGIMKDFLEYESRRDRQSDRAASRRSAAGKTASGRRKGEKGR